MPGAPRTRPSAPSSGERSTGSWWPRCCSRTTPTGASRSARPASSPRASRSSSCLRRAHADCPRYLRGAAPGTKQPSRLSAVPRATLAALLILVVSAVISFGFVLQRGGIDLPVTDGSPASTAVAAIGTARPEPSDPAMATSTADPGMALTPGPTPSPPATPGLTMSPTLTPDPTPLPPAAATPRPAPAATPKSDRYRVLRACPGRRGCWIYTVRAGDNLFSIANWFGVSLKTIYAWNPQYPAARLRAGDPIRMPPPTR